MLLTFIIEVGEILDLQSLRRQRRLRDCLSGMTVGQLGYCFSGMNLGSRIDSK